MMIPQRFGPMGQPAGCRICGRTLSFHQQVSGQICSNWRCKAATLEQEMAAHRKKAAAVMGVRRFESYCMVVVPDDPAAISRLPQSRKQAHINFLFNLCLQAATMENVDDDTSFESDSTVFDPPAVIASNVCAVCRGTCCHLGKVHAFLDTAAIRRFILRSTLTDPLKIVYAYFAYLPEKTVSDACVYQTEQGCTLPRWMRADICNAYRCKGLAQAEELIRRDDTNRLFVVVRKDNRITRSAFVQDYRIRHYPSAEHFIEMAKPTSPSGKET
jgi:hypothetical protein